MKWLLINNDFIDNPKVQNLPKKLFKAYINTLCVASANTPRWAIPDIKSYAFRMRVSIKEAQKTLDKLESFSLVNLENSTYFVSGWQEYQDDKRLPPDVWQKIRVQVFDRDNYTCNYCGAIGGKLECDHVIPICQGGSNSMENLTTSCQSCNRSKGGKLLEEWRI